MSAFVRKVAVLVGPNQRLRWLMVVGMAVAVSVAEAASTVLVFALLSVLMGESSDVALPVVGKVGAWLPWEDAQLIAALGLVTGMAFVVRGALILVQNYVQFRVAENAGSRLSTRLLAGYLAMPYPFHLQRNSSELIRNAFDSVQRFVDDGLVPGVKVLGKLAIVVGVVLVLLMSSPLATVLAVAALGPLTWGVLHKVHPRVKWLGRRAQSMARDNLKMLQQSLQGVREITVLGRERSFVDEYARDRRELARSRYLRLTAAQVPRVVIETGLVIFIVAFVWVAALSEGGMVQALPLLGLFGYAAARLMPEVQEITKGWNSLKFVGPAIDDICTDLAAFDTERQGGDEAVEPLVFREVLRARGVSYRYPNAESDALTGVDFEIRRGQSVGVVGPSGEGKSTLVDVLLGLLNPSAGQITVDGVDLHRNARAWQAQIGVVPQNVFLVDDTVRANVALGVPPAEVDETALAQAVATAQLDAVVASLPHGLETTIGERGMRLSGGQRQRLAIARALYRRPSVLVFDESTSALDQETEAALLDALALLYGDRTLITVAHRLSAVEACDSVLLMRDGRVVDQGPLSQLTRRPWMVADGQPQPVEGSARTARCMP